MTPKQANHAAEKKLQKIERMLEEVGRDLLDARELVRDSGHPTGQFMRAWDMLCRLREAVRNA